MYRSAASVGKEGTLGISTTVILSLSKDLPQFSVESKILLRLSNLFALSARSFDKLRMTDF